MNNEIEQIAQQNKMSIEFVTWFFNEKKSACGEHWFLMLGAMWEGWKGRSIEMDRLAAENVALKASIPPLKMINDVTDSWDDVSLAEEVGFNLAISAIMKNIPETPSTDACLAGIKADGVEEFAAYQRAITEEWACKEGHSSLLKVAESAELFAKQLREGADK